MKRPVEDMFSRDEVDEARRSGGDIVTIGMNLTDMGNAERLVARYRDRIRYVPPRKLWLVWDGRRWREDETGEVQRLAKQTIRAGYAEAQHAGTEDGAKAIAKHFAKSEDAARIAAMIKIASTEEGIPVLPNQLDANPWLLNVANGTVDLAVGKLREHRREDLITKVVPVNYDPDAQHELWDRFLEESTGGDGELKAFLQRMAGYCATGSTQEKHFFFVYSKKSSTGKSTFCDAVRTALGGYAMDADFDTWIEQSNQGGNRGDLARLAGSRLVISVEVRKRAKFDAKTMKQITGGDPVTCAAKYEKEFTYQPTYKILLASNSAPVIQDDDRPLFERCLRVPFDVQVPPAKQDASVKGRLSDPSDPVVPAVLRWIVDGVAEWSERGLGVPPAVKECSDAYRVEMDRFGAFLSERCAFEEGAWVRVADLRKDYEDWCKDAGIRYPLPVREMKDRLGEMGANEARTRIRGRHWRGVRLLGPDESEDDLRGDRGDNRDKDPPNFSTRAHEEKVPGNPVTPDTPVTPPDQPGFHWESPSEDA